MSDEIPVGDLTYVSSKRASEISGYAQDYIGQLARKGLIEARRVGGLWYVYMDSLESYKSQPEPLVPAARPEQAGQSDLDVLVSFDGKDYISASRASKITGYNQDYIGQLARSGKILARQVGNRWYVDHAGLLAHKKEKDDLLASVQSAAVGIRTQNPVEVQNSHTEKNDNEAPLLNYLQDEGDLTPQINKIVHEDPTAAPPHVTYSEHVTDLKIRTKSEIPMLHKPTPDIFGSGRREPMRSHAAQSAITTKRGRSGFRPDASMLMVIGGAIILLSVASYTIYRAPNGPFATNLRGFENALVTDCSTFVMTVAGGIEQLLSPDLTYIRKG